MSSPERGTRGGYEEPYYSQYGTRGISVTPIIDEEQRFVYMRILSIKILFYKYYDFFLQRIFYKRRSICFVCWT